VYSFQLISHKNLQKRHDERSEQETAASKKAASAFTVFPNKAT